MGAPALCVLCCSLKPANSHAGEKGTAVTYAHQGLLLHLAAGCRLLMTFEGEDALPGLIGGHGVEGATSASAKPGLDSCSVILFSL